MQKQGLYAILLVVSAQLEGGAATAADLGVLKAPELAPTAAPLWSGFFVGAHVGAAAAQEKFVDNFPVFDAEVDAKPSLQGWLGGLQVGFNHQHGWFVLGAEAELSWANINAGTFPCFSFGDQRCSAQAQWHSSITGRVGAAMGSAFLYVKGGAAWMRDKYTNVATCAGQQPTSVRGIDAACGDLFVGQQTRPGWIVGAGLEYALTNNWSAKVEYNYSDFGKRSVWLFDEQGDAFSELVHQRISSVKLGVNYRLGAPQAPAISAYAQARTAKTAHAQAIDDEDDAGRVSAFAGIDVAPHSISGWAGSLVALSKDLDTSGGRVYIFGGTGRYRYPASGSTISGTYTTGDVLAGYAWEGDNYSINWLAGLNAANHMLSQQDPTNPVQGTAAGIKIRASAHVNPTPAVLLYGETEYSSAFQTFFASTKYGYDVFNAGVFLGPEASFSSDERSRDWRIGLHATELKFGKIQVDIAGGYSNHSIFGTGPYGRLELSTNF
jgi:outer membrane immunogenic protein